VPLVVKLAGDPVYERSRRLGLFDGTQEEFEAAAGTPLVRVLRRVLAARLRDGAAATEPVTAAQAFAAIELALERAAADK
jgi:hypothetical protein